MNVKIVLLAVISAGFFCFSLADCRTDRPAYIKEKQRCITLFHKSYAPEKQLQRGLMLLDDKVVEECFEKLKYEFGAFEAGGTCDESYFPTQLEESFEKFSKACLHRTDRKECDALLEKSKVDNIRNAEGSTLLMIAAREGDLPSFDYLILKGASVNKVDHSGKNVLMYALGHKDYPVNEWDELDIVKKILGKGLHPQKIDLEGNSSLTYAIENKSSFDIIQVLVENGANVNLGIGTREDNLDGKKVKVRLPIFKAIFFLRDDCVDFFVKKGADVKETFVWDAYYSAIQKDLSPTDLGKAENIGRVLLNAGADPNYQTADGNSVAIWAFFKNSPVLYNAFFESGLDVNDLYIGGRRWSPMRMAVMGDGVTDMAKKILEHKFDINTRMDKNGYAYKLGEEPAVDDAGDVIIDALGWAIDAGNLNMVKMLINKKANVNAEYKESSDRGKFYTPLYFALERSKIDIVKLLLKAGANPNKVSGDMIPLFVAVSLQDAEMVKILIRAKADVNAKFPGGATMLEAAEDRGTDEIVELLKKAGARKPFRGNFVNFCLNADITEGDVLDAIRDGADVNETDDDQGWTPLHAVAQNGKNPKVLELLIKKGAFINAMTKTGFTPFLSAAAHNPNPDFIRKLIAAGADIEVKDSDGWNALELAVAGNSSAVVALLLKTILGENLDETKKNALLLMAIKKNSNPKVIITLIKAGFNAEPEKSWMTKPLHVALEEEKNIDFIKILLQGHARVDDYAVRLARDLPMETQEEKRYRNQVIDMLLKAKKTQR